MGYGSGATGVCWVFTAGGFAVVCIAVIGGTDGVQRVWVAQGFDDGLATGGGWVGATGGFAGGVVIRVAKSIKRIIGADSGYRIGATVITAIITANRFAGGVISIIA